MLGSEQVKIRIHVSDHFAAGRSSFAAKKADAVPRVSFARRISWFSFFNRRTSKFSELGTPGRTPGVILAWQNHLRTAGSDAGFVGTLSRWHAIANQGFPERRRLLISGSPEHTVELVEKSQHVRRLTSGGEVNTVDGA